MDAQLLGFPDQSEELYKKILAQQGNNTLQNGLLGSVPTQNVTQVPTQVQTPNINLPNASGVAQSMASLGSQQQAQAMSGKNALMNQRDSQMQSTTAQATQGAQVAQAQHAAQQQQLLKLAMMLFNGGGSGAGT